MTRRVLAAALAGLLAIVGVLLVASYVRAADARAVAALNPTAVLVVTEEVPRGAGVQLGRNVEIRQVPATAVAEGAVANASELDGLVADTTLHPGEQVFAARFAKPEAITNDEVVVPENLVQVTIRLEPERVVGGRLEPGDTVGVVLSWTGEDSVAYTHPLLHKVLVTKVEDPRGTQDDDDDQAAPESHFVTLAVLAKDADKVIWGAEHGTIWLTLERETSDTSGGTTVTWGAPNPPRPEEQQ